MPAGVALLCLRWKLRGFTRSFGVSRTCGPGEAAQEKVAGDIALREGDKLHVLFSCRGHEVSYPGEIGLFIAGCMLELD